jgi:NitT/TauT family transport system permease protein/putative hydroxymethylpyrimidine transport system permease protein
MPRGADKVSLLLEHRSEARQPAHSPGSGQALLRRYGLAGLVFVAVIAFFQWGVPLLGVPDYILPTPSSVLRSMLDFESDLPYHFGVTLLEALGGLLVGSLFAFLLAVLFVHVRPIEDALYPWVIVLQTVPLVAIAPMLVIWFGNGLLPRAAMSAIFAFFPILVNTVRGLRRADTATLELLESYAISRWQLFWTLRMPNSLPFLFAGLKVGSTLAVIGAIVGEFAGAGQGLGFVITVSTYYLDTSRTFAAIGYASLIGISLYLLLLWLERRLVFWETTI